MPLDFRQLIKELFALEKLDLQAIPIIKRIFRVGGGGKPNIVNSSLTFPGLTLPEVGHNVWHSIPDCFWYSKLVHCDLSPQGNMFLFSHQAAPKETGEMSVYTPPFGEHPIFHFWQPVFVKCPNK